MYLFYPMESVGIGMSKQLTKMMLIDNGSHVDIDRYVCIHVHGQCVTACNRYDTMCVEANKQTL